MLFGLLCLRGAESAEPLKLVQTIALEGVEGRIDHLAVDVETNRIFVAALGNNTVEVIDLKMGKPVATIKDVKEPQGVALIPGGRAIAVGCGEGSECRIYDGSLKLTSVTKGLDDADNVRYDAAANRFYVGYGRGALAVVDPERGAKVGDIKLAGHPESFQLESAGKRIFVNIPSARQVAVIDREKAAVIAKWAVKEAESNFPMALDEIDHRLFIGCRNPAKMLVLDTESGKTVSSIACCGDTDDVFFDAARKRIYVSGGEGCIATITQRDADQYELVARTATASGARTSLFVPGLSRLYLAVPHRGSQTAEIRVYEARAQP